MVQYIKRIQVLISHQNLFLLFRSEQLLLRKVYGQDLENRNSEKRFFGKSLFGKIF